MEFKYKAAPTYRQKASTQNIMMHLTIGLLVVYAFALYRSYTLGMNYLVNAVLLLVTSVAVAVGTELIWALATKQKPAAFLKSSFPWVTAIILTLMVPVNTELYAIGVSTFIAIFFSKLVFGGFGQNVFNPAAVGRAIIFASFAGNVSVDLITSATPTATLASNGWIASAEQFQLFLNDFGGLFNLAMGNYQGAMGETSALLILVVAVYLTIMNVIDWRIPVTYLGVLFLGSFFVGVTHGLGLSYALYCVLTGGAVFGAVFMLTDPVTSPTTRAGKIVFASIAALITMTIRYYANLPEGVLYSILFVNILTPVIDRVFAGKQVERIAKNIMITFGVVALSVVSIFALGFGLKGKEYQSILVPEFDRGATVSLGDDYRLYQPELIKKDGDSYLVSVLGYGLLPEKNGGAGGISHTEDVYARNEVMVTLDPGTGTVVSAEVVTFGDTTGIGDKVMSDGFYYQFKEATLESDVDVVSTATYTSKSVIAAVNYVLRGCPKTVALSDDFAAYEAEVVDQGNGLYHVSVLGYGLLPEKNGGAGGVSHTEDVYARNEFDIVIEKGKVVSVDFVTFGDTTGIGDKVMEESYLGQYTGKTLNDSVDVVSKATFTSKSVAAAVSAALQVAAGK